jgi:hypothetical protein
VIATDTKGNTQTAPVKVNAVRKNDYIRIIVSRESGLSPLEMVLTLDSSLDLAQASLTHTGPGEVELLSKDGNEYKFKITIEGIYYFKAQVTDPRGTVYEDTVAVNVLSKEQVDILLRGKWEVMKEAIASQNVDAAILNFVAGSQEVYRIQFEALRPLLPLIVQELNAAGMNLVEMDNRTAEYELLVEREGVRQSFSVRFIKDQNGLWKIWRY